MEAGIGNPGWENQPSNQQERIAALQIENSTLRADLGRWKQLHQAAKEREHELLKALQDSKAQVAYLKKQLYEKKSEQASKKPETVTTPDDTKKRHRGQQKGSPIPPRRDQSHLPAVDEPYDLDSDDCPFCGLPFIVMPDTDDSEIIEIQDVKGYRRTIRRKKYRPACSCPGNKGIITAPGPARLIPNSRYGTSIWIHILIHKFEFQVPVNRILKNMSLHGVSIPAGSVGDNLKRLAPLFEPIYAALEERSIQAQWWQADETRWRVFETTKTKQTFRWYLWVFISSESIVHVIDPTRSEAVIEKHLGTAVEGILLVDRYSAYKSYVRKNTDVVLAFCWAHVRRDFREAGLKYKNLAPWADQWETRINELFHLNSLRTGYPVGSTAFNKQDTELRACLEKMKMVRDEELRLPRLHHQQKAVLTSLRNHWDGLVIFADNPVIPMDNNGSERTLRNSVVGRKNYFGSGTIGSSRLTAMMFSIFETLKLWNINPVEWLGEYFLACALNNGTPPDDVAEHLPWNISKRKEQVWTFCGRDFTQKEIDGIAALTDEDTSHSRAAIARMACEQLQWRKPDGTLKLQNMRLALQKMEVQGLVHLPEARRHATHDLTPIEHGQRTAPGPAIIDTVDKLPELRFQTTATAEELSLWSEYIDRYHYLGYTPLAGAQMRYFVYAGDQLVALLGFSASAWRLAPRDWHIGWSDEKRRQNLNLVINNSRFLILPWIESKNLASKILSLAGKRVADDWEARYKYRPILIETFVEKKRFNGTCYKAANWIWVGTTKGRGRADRLKEVKLPQKEILIYPLHPDYKKFLA
jgi:transposase